MNMPPEGGEHQAKVKGDRLLLQGDHHYEYDEFGNLIADRWGKAQCREQRFEWNCEHRLVRFTDVRHYDDEGFPRHTLTHSWRYEYDAFGRRIRKTDEETGKSTLFFWQDDRMVTECDEAHADFAPDTVLNKHTKATDFDCTSYLYEPGGSFRPLAQLRGRGVGSNVSYYVNDQIGTPQELLDEDGNVVWSAIYRAYGHAEMQAGVRQPLRFQGQYADEESGLHYNRYRYYNPLSGRYISQDPISIRGGSNTYCYVCDPLAWVDPLGLSMRTECMGKTPGKNSRTGREVIERMRSKDKIRDINGETYFQASDNNWYPLSEADMSHTTDAVSWWNSTGRHYGPKSKEVREWMLDSDNYYLDHYSINRSQGARLGQVYLSPIIKQE